MEFQQSVGTRNLCIRNKSFLIREAPSLVLNFYLFSKTATNGLKSAFFYFWKNFYSKKLLSHIDITRERLSYCPVRTACRSGDPCVYKRPHIGLWNFYGRYAERNGKLKNALPLEGAS